MIRRPLLRGVLAVSARFFKLAPLLGVAAAFKLAILARLTSRTIAVNLPGCASPFRVRGKTADDTVVEAVFADGQYPVLPGFHPTRILDGGAHCGAVTAFFAEHYPNAEIVAIEPDQSNFEALSSNVRTRAGVTLLRGGLWSTTGQLHVDEAHENYSHKVSASPEGFNETTVPAYTIRDVMARMEWDSVDLLKLDIEGSELELLSRNAVEWLRRTRVLMVELHESYAPGCGKALFSALNAFDYTVMLSGENLVVQITSPMESAAR